MSTVSELNQNETVKDTQPEASQAEPSPQPQAPAAGAPKSRFGLGFLIGFIVAIGIISFPATLGINFSQNQQVSLEKTTAENLDLKMALAKEELGDVEKKLEEITKTEAIYNALMASKPTLEARKLELQGTIDAIAAQSSQEEKGLLEKVKESLQLQ